jgi:SAM-dependent methyltransferase
MERYTAYDDFAWLYNKEWTRFAESIFPGLKGIAGEILQEGVKVLDLCCGTGQLAKILTDNGYKVTGIDGSSKMLKYARENAPKARFVAADARSFKLPQVYNVVFSTFDSLNHIMTLPELQQVFKNVYQCLVKDGIFVFDMTTKTHFQTQIQDYKQISETPGYFYTMHVVYNIENKISQWHCTIFQRKVRGWRRSDISLQQTFYDNTEIKTALKKSGFSNILTYPVSRQNQPQKTTRNAVRIFYYAQKP